MRSSVHDCPQSDVALCHLPFCHYHPFYVHPIWQLCDEIVAAGPTDEATLHPLMIVLKDTHRHSDIRKLWEAACEKDPKNPDLLRSLFGALVRCASRHFLLTGRTCSRKHCMRMNRLGEPGVPIFASSSFACIMLRFVCIVFAH